MRILHLSSEYPPQSVFGLGRYAHELARAQSRLGHYVEVLTNSLGGQEHEIERDGVLVRRVHCPPPPKSPATSAMLLHFNLQLVERAIEAESKRNQKKFAIINAHDWLTAPAAFHLGRLFDTPVVTTFHDVIFNKVRGREFSSEDAHVAGIENWACQFSAKILVLSETVKQELQGSYHAPANKIDVVPSGVDIRPLLKNEFDQLSRWRRKLLPDHENLLLYVGRLDPEKGIETLFQAVEPLLERKDLKLALAGTGLLEQSIKSHLESSRLNSAVRLLGYLPMEELRIAYAAADAVIVPSLYEPFGLVALEAQRMGTPVICSDTGGLSESVQITQGGLAFPTGNPGLLSQCIAKLLDDPELRAQLGKIGQENVAKHFDWTAVAKRIDDTYAVAAKNAPPKNEVCAPWEYPRNFRSAVVQGANRDVPTTTTEPPSEQLSDICLFWDTSQRDLLTRIIDQLHGCHARKALNGKVFVVPVILHDECENWQACKNDRFREVVYIDLNAGDESLKSALCMSALAISMASVAEPLMQRGILSPKMMPTIVLGSRPNSAEPFLYANNDQELHVLITKLLCDENARKTKAPAAIATIPSVVFSPPPRKKPLVLHVVPQFVTGGAETTILDLIKGTTEKVDHALLSIGRMEGPLVDELKELKISIQRCDSKRDDICNAIKEQRPDLLHLHSLSYVPAWIQAHRTLTKIPILETEHVVNIGSGHFGYVDTVICVSNAVRDSHEVFSNVCRQNGIDPPEFDVIYNGINERVFNRSMSQSEARKRLSLPLDRPVIGRVSALARNKLPMEALQLIPVVLKHLPNALFVIVGDGPKRKPAEKWIHDNGLQDSVIFLGERRDIPEVLRSFDVFAYYTTKDALGNVLLEAISAGVPVVTTNVEGTAEAVGNAPGDVVPLNDFDAFASAVTKWINQIKSGFVSPFTLPRHFCRSAMSESYAQVYERMLHEPQNGKRNDCIEMNEVTVLMPVYNPNLSWLETAIRSIENQTYPHWKLLIVDDGSDEHHRKSLNEYIDNNESLKNRTNILRLPKNCGVAAALNAGLKACTTELVARMDCDDLMLPDRLALQSSAFKHTAILDVLGGEAELIDGEGTPIDGKYSYPIGHRQIVQMLTRSCAFAHPTVMYRRSSVMKVGGYQEECRHFEDYDLWVRMAESGLRFQNLSIPLIRYRIHPNSISRTQQQVQQTGSIDCSHRAQKLNIASPRRHTPRVLFTGLRHSYGIPGRGLSIEQFFFGRAMERMREIELLRLPADELIQRLGKKAAGEALLKTAKERDVDMVFTVLGNPELDFRSADIQALTELGIVTVNWNCDDHWRLPYTAEFASHYSKMVTTDPVSWHTFHELGFGEKIILSQWGCNPFDYKPGASKDIDICFIGQPYGQRPTFINALIDAGLKVVVEGSGWRGGAEISFEKMIDILQRSKIALNFAASSQGMRTQIKARFFEIPACGTFMLTEPSEGMDEYLVPGRHYDTFQSVAELIERARHWLDRSDRDDLALEASNIVRSVHTYSWRLNQVFEAAGLFES